MNERWPLANNYPSLFEVAALTKGSLAIKNDNAPDRNQLIQDETYKPLKRAVSSGKNGSLLIGVIVPNFSEPFFSAAYSAIEETGSTFGYNVMIGQSNDNVADEALLIEKMIKQKVDGIIVSIAKNSFTYDHLMSTEQSGIPVVFFDRIPEINNIHFVTADLKFGLMDGIRKLVNAGHQSIGLINSTGPVIAAKQRLLIYKEGLRENNLIFNTDHVVITDLTPDGNTKAINKLLSVDRPPTAVVVFNDIVLLDCLKALKAKKMEDQFTFISFANLPYWRYFDHKPLGSIEQFPIEQGKLSTELLIKLMGPSKNKPGEKVNFNQVYIDSKMVLL